MGPSRLQPLAPSAALFLALLLCGCAGSGANVPGLAPAGGERAPQGAADSTSGASSCGGAIANFEKVITSDADTGNLNRPVYDRVVADLRPVKASCAAGNNGQALAQLAAVRSRYGYP